MSDIIINGKIYTGVETISVKNTDGETVVFSKGDGANDIINGTITDVTSDTLGSVESIRNNAFSGMEIETVSVPSNVSSIGDSAFANNNITTLTLADGVETIGNNAFQNNSITEVTIPASITSIGDSAFAGNNLTEITMESDTPPIVTSTTFPATLQATNVSYNGYDNYATNSNWETYKNTLVRGLAIPSTITVTVNNYLGELVSGASVTITGNGKNYTGTTNASGVFSQGDLQPATYTISVADLEGFNTPSTSEVVVEENTQNSVTITYLEKPAVTVYGVSGLYQSEPTLTRTDDAVGMNCSVDTSTGIITSDFDNVFPYNEMTRETDILGNVMVNVPSMWFRIGVDGSNRITDIAVSSEKGETGNWYQTRAFKYGAYYGNVQNSKLTSVAGVYPTDQVSISDFRTYANNNGDGYHLADLYSRTILSFLWLIEVATKNSESIMHGGYMPTNTPVAHTTGVSDNISGQTGYDLDYISSKWHNIEDFIGGYWYNFYDGAYGGDNGDCYVKSKNYRNGYP